MKREREKNNQVAHEIEDLDDYSISCLLMDHLLFLTMLEVMNEYHLSLTNLNVIEDWLHYSIDPENPDWAT